MGTLVDTFAEGLSVATWACTLTLAVPGLALALTARRCRATVVSYYVAGAALLAWAKAAGYWAVAPRGWAMAAAALVAAGTYAAAWRAPGHSSPLATGAGMVAGALAGWLWLPCVGERLGDILEAAAADRARAALWMLVYVLGALAPLVLMPVAAYALPPVARLLDRTAVALVGAGVGAAYAVTLAIGRYDDLIGELYRISSGY